MADTFFAVRATVIRNMTGSVLIRIMESSNSKLVGEVARWFVIFRTTKKGARGFWTTESIEWAFEDRTEKQARDRAAQLAILERLEKVGRRPLRGEIHPDEQEQIWRHHDDLIPCPRCRGSSHYEPGKCSSCYGSGKCPTCGGEKKVRLAVRSEEPST